MKISRSHDARPIACAGTATIVDGSVIHVGFSWCRATPPFARTYGGETHTVVLSRHGSVCLSDKPDGTQCPRQSHLGYGRSRIPMSDTYSQRRQSALS